MDGSLLTRYMAVPLDRRQFLRAAGSSLAEREGVPFLGVGFAHETPPSEQSFEWTYVPYPKPRHVARGTRRLLDGVLEGGYDVVRNRKFGMGNNDFSSLIFETADIGADVLLSNPIPPDGITAVKQMESNGYTPEAMMFVRASHSNGWWKALGELGAYTATSPGWVPGLADNGNERFRSNYADEYELGGSTTPVTADQTYTSGQWWQGEQRLVFPDGESDLAMEFQYPMEAWGAR